MKTHVHVAIPVLSTSMLDEAFRSLQRRDGASVFKDQIAEFRQKVRGPSVGSVHHSLCFYIAPRSLDSHPAVGILFRNAIGGCVRLEVQVARLKDFPEQGVDEFVRPSAKNLSATPEVLALMRTRYSHLTGRMHHCAYARLHLCELLRGFRVLD